MGLLPRRIRPAYVAAPVEPPVPAEVRIAQIDAQTYEAYLAGDMPRVNRLIDMRLAIRPARKPRPVPVIPGRVESIIDNYWENP